MPLFFLSPPFFFLSFFFFFLRFRGSGGIPSYNRLLCYSMPGRFRAPSPALHCKVRAAFALLLSALARSRLLRPRLRGARAARQERAAFAAILGQPSPGACGQRAGRPLSRRGVARRGEGPNAPGSFQNAEARLSLYLRGRE